MFRHYALLVCSLLAFGAWVQAHDPGLSTATLKIANERLNAQLTFAPADVQPLLPMDVDQNGQVTPAEFAVTRARLRELAWDALEVRLDGQRVPATDVIVQLDDHDNLQIQLNFPFRVATHLTVRSTFLGDLPLGHRQYLSLRDDHGNLLGEFLLDAKNNAFETTLTESAASESVPLSFKQFLLLGVEHIATGYDHLLFLFGLLIVGTSFLSVGKIITSFTVAHSITLALATFHLVHLPPSVVEPLIAVSIIYVGIENIFHRNLERRWLLTFAFGLVHGLGFASVLRELGIGFDGSGIAVPLVSFNLGVEVGQVAIAAVALPLIWKLKQRPSFVARYAPACSVVVIVAGTYWLIERTLFH